jgi:hypothetical protein
MRQNRLGFFIKSDDRTVFELLFKRVLDDGPRFVMLDLNCWLSGRAIPASAIVRSIAVDTFNADEEFPRSVH